MYRLLLPRDAVHSADYAVARRLSVCPCVTRGYSVETARRLIKLFFTIGLHTTLVFAVPNVMASGGASYGAKGLKPPPDFVQAPPDFCIK